MDEALKNIRNDLEVDLIAVQDVIERTRHSMSDTASKDAELLERLRGHLSSVLRGLNAKLGDRSD